MSKAALNAAGVSLAHDLKGDGIAVAILHPGESRAVDVWSQLCQLRQQCTNKFPTSDAVATHGTAADNFGFHVYP